MAIEGVPDIPMFRQNTAGFVHELPAGDLSNVDGETNYVRVQVLTNAGALDRDKQLAVVEPAHRPDRGRRGDDPALAERTWVLLTEAVPGGWGLSGHAQHQRRARRRGPRADRGAAGEGRGLTHRGADPRRQGLRQRGVTGR